MDGRTNKSTNGSACPPYICRLLTCQRSIDILSTKLPLKKFCSMPDLYRRQWDMFDNKSLSLKACLSQRLSQLCLQTTTNDYVPINYRSFIKNRTNAMILDFFSGSPLPTVVGLQVCGLRLNIDCLCVWGSVKVRLSKSTCTEFQLKMWLEAWESPYFDCFL